MKFYATMSIFKYSWDQVAVGFWSRYPNPHSTHVLSEDVLNQVIANGRLVTKRLITKTNSIPKWGERFVSGPKHVCVVEESIVDPKSKTLTTYTRNIGYTSVMTVEEKCTYRPHDENEEWTVCDRQAFIDSKLIGLSYALQTFGVERFKMNVTKSVKGFNHVLNKLYPMPQESHSLHVNSSKQKLKNTAEAAKKLASTMVVTN